MNIETFSPALILLYVFALLWILMDVQLDDLTPMQKWLTAVSLMILCLFNHFLRLHIGSAMLGKLIFLTMHLPFFMIFLHLTKCGIIKMAFMILSAVVFTSPAIFVGNFVKRIFVANSAALLLANLSTYILMLLLAHFVFKQKFSYMIKNCETQFLLRFSLVPFLYYLYLFAAMNVDFSSLDSLGGYVVRLLPTIYVFVFYFLLMRNFKDMDERRELETSQATLHQQLSAAAKQIDLLNKAQFEVAVHQHNMRHHLNAIDGLLSSQGSQQAMEYIKSVWADVDSITPKRFCENELVNLLCSSFCQKAEQRGIQLKVEAKLPQQLSVSDTELCSVLSNGLENALNAVELSKYPDKSVELYCDIKANKLLIEIKNHYSKKIIFRDGLPVSDREGHGYGCRSIQTIVKKHRGLCSFEADDEVFILRVMIPL